MINEEFPTISDFNRFHVRAASRVISPASGPFNFSVIHAWVRSIQPSWNR